MPARVKAENFEVEVLTSAIPVLVEFYSDSCIPCKQLSPILGDIEEEYENQIKVVKVNVNFENELADQYQIMASPTMLLFQQGKELKRIRGLIKKEELKQIIHSIL